MHEFPELLIDVPLACRVLGISIEQSLVLCKTLGIKPVRRHDEMFLERNALDIIYRRLYH